MQLVLHTGAHFTEADRLLKCLLRNQDELMRRGVAVPGPGRYRRLIRDALNAMHTAEPAPDARDVLLDTILDNGDADRVVLCNPHFFGSVQLAVQSGTLYPKAAEKLARVASIFPNDEIEIFFGIRNPASFVPTVYEKMGAKTVAELLGARDPVEIRWSGLIASMQRAIPHAKITVWSNEDAPLIWAQILRKMGGFEPDEQIIGGFDLLSTIMSKDGMQRFRAYLKSHPVMSETQRHRVIAAFLDKFGLPEAFEEELNMPGLSERLVEDMTDAYEEDMIEIQRIPNVEVIAP